MQINIFPIVCLMLFSSIGWAGEVHDPNKILQSFGFGKTPVEFEKAFACGASFDYSSDTKNCEVKCNDSFCQDVCYGQETSSGRVKNKLYIEDCTANSVSIYGDNGLSVQVTKEDYERGNNTILISVLKNIGHFMQPDGDVSLVFAMPMRRFDYVHDGIREQIEAIDILAHIEVGGVQKPSVEVVLARQGFGVWQLLKLSTGKNEFLRGKGVFDIKGY